MALDLNHYTEWLDSCVSPDFINANVQSLSGEEAFERVAGKALYIAGENANQAANAEVFRINKRYRPMYAGGWWVAGCDPLNGFEQMEWGQLKPNTPRPNYSKPGRFHKYETPAKTDTRLFLPHIPASVARGIVERYNATAIPQQHIPEHEIQQLELEILWDSKAFWPWFIKHPRLPLIITEGAKKTGASCTAGYATIGLPGVWNGRKPFEKDEDGKKIPNQKAFLKDELMAFAQPGRKIIFAFDCDEKIETLQKVWKATESTAFLFLRDSKAKPYFASWSHEQGKGIDDFIAANGADAFALLITQAQDYEAFKIRCQLARGLTREPDLTVNQALLKLDFSKLPDSGIVAIASCQGTGKTQNFLVPLAEKAESLLLIGHLISLTRANSDRMGCTYRTDLDRAAGRFLGPNGEPVYRVSTVIDSLMSFNPRDFEGATIVLDEACQLLRAALTSSNIAKRGNRGAILTRLRQILQRAKLILVADADLSDWALEYLEALRGDGKQAFLIKNNHVPTGYSVDFYEGAGASAIVKDALELYKGELAKGEDGQHVAIATDSQAKAKAIAKMAREIEGADVLDIHRDTSGGDLEQAFISNPTQYLSYLDKPCLIIYSPSMGTGVSIEAQNIARVFGIFEGMSITDADIIQMLQRVRVKCPRSVWVKEKGGSYCRLSKSSSPAAIKSALKSQVLTEASTIRHELTETAYSGLVGFTWDTDPHIEGYCQIEAERNRGMPNLRARVAVRLEMGGNRIIMRNQWESLPTAMALKATREQIEADDAKAIEVAPEIGEMMAQLIAAKEAPTPEEKQQLKKYHLADFYLEQVTAQLVLADRKGKRRSEVKRFEELMDKELSATRDVAAIERQLKWGSEISPQDIRTGSVASEVRRAIGLDKWITRTDSWMSGCDELEAFKAHCLQERVASGIKAALGYTVKAEASAQQILGDLLRQVGVRISGQQKSIKGKRSRQYQIDADSLAEMRSLVERRAARREAPEPAHPPTQSLHTPSEKPPAHPPENQAEKQAEEGFQVAEHQIPILA